MEKMFYKEIEGIIIFARNIPRNINHRSFGYAASSVRQELDREISWRPHSSEAKSAQSAEVAPTLTDK